MPMIRLRLFVAVACLVLTAVLAAAAPRLGVRAWGDEGGRAAAASVAMIPTYALRARLPDLFEVFPISILADPSRGRLYVSVRKPAYTALPATLNIIDTAQARRVETLQDIQLYSLTLTQDRNYVIGYWPSETNDPNKLVVIDAETYAIVDEFTLSCAPETVDCDLVDMAAGPDGRLYWISYQDTLVNVLDVATGTILNRFVAGDESKIRGIEIAGDKLFVSESIDYIHSPEIHRYDISTLTASLELTVLDEFGSDMAPVAPDGSYIIGNSPFGIIQYSTETLRPIRTLYESDACCGTTNGIAISPDSQRVFQLFRLLNENQPFRVYDAETGNLVNTGVVDISQIVYGGWHEYLMAPLANGGLAVTFPKHVDLYAATHHATALPIAFADYCPGGPFRDDFSNPNSGWPSTASATLAVGYSDNQYRIRHGKENRWFGVTRGDKWLNGDEAAVDTRVIAATGSSGLIFGLKEDWSHFYTFEIYPHLGRWAVFEFYAASGWALQETGFYYSIMPTTEWDRVKVYSLGTDIRFYVNDNYVHDMSNQDGRVGLSAGSFDPGFEARFDKYEFIGKNCGLGERSGNVESGPFLDRPPLEDFLK